MSDVVTIAITYIVKHTKYSAYQCYRVMEIVGKWGPKARSHLNKKQNEILNMIEYLLGVGTENPFEKTN